MSGNPVASRYAEALFELIKRQGRLEEVSEELGQLAALLHEHQALRRLLVNPGVEVDDKLSVLDRGFPDGWAEELRAFVRMVLAMGRAEALEEIVEVFGELVDAEHGVARVQVRMARPLTDALTATLTARLEGLGYRRIEMTKELDPSLLGGIQVFIGHRVFDGSLRTKLAQLRQRLKTVRVH